MTLLVPFSTPQSSSTVNLFETLCSGCDVQQCEDCRFATGEDQPTLPQCLPVMENARSTGGTVTLEMVSIEPGYWRATTTSDNVLACYNEAACLGGVTESPGYCLQGYEGPCE